MKTVSDKHENDIWLESKRNWTIERTETCLYWNLWILLLLSLCHGSIQKYLGSFRFLWKFLRGLSWYSFDFSSSPLTSGWLQLLVSNTVILSSSWPFCFDSSRKPRKLGFSLCCKPVFVELQSVTAFLWFSWESFFFWRLYRLEFSTGKKLKQTSSFGILFCFPLLKRLHLVLVGTLSLKWALGNYFEVVYSKQFVPYCVLIATTRNLFYDSLRVKRNRRRWDVVSHGTKTSSPVAAVS